MTTGRVPLSRSPRFPGQLAFDSVWSVAMGFEGWLTTDQARALWQLAASLQPGSHVVEIGSHHGRSTAVLGGAVRGSSHVTAIDPFDHPRWGGGHESRDAFLHNMDLVHLATTVRLVQSLSGIERRRWHEPLDLLFIDGAHDRRSVEDDLHWSEFVRANQVVAVHDAFSSIGVTAAIFRRLLLSNSLRYSGRVGSLALFRKDKPTVASRLALSAQVFWFVRNVLVKVTINRGWARLTTLLGHCGPDFPY